jgi:L-lactate dehydrogenase complex protein LldG
VNEAREEVLRRVRAALSDGPAAASLASAAVRDDTAGGEALVRLLHARLVEYKAEVRRVGPGDIADAVADMCRARDARRIGVPPGLPPAWRPAGLEIVEDAGLSPGELDGLDGVLTGCTLAIAATGTLLLAAGPADGRRALTLVPDLHVCVVEAGAVVADLPAALALVAPLVRDERRPLTFVSGPSATSDIELERVEGVHGPRQLAVLICG